MELSILALRVRALSVLRGLQKHPVISAYLDVFDAVGRDAAAFANAYGELCARIFACGAAGCHPIRRKFDVWQCHVCREQIRQTLGGCHPRRGGGI